MITKQKTNADNIQMNASQKNKCWCYEQANESLLKKKYQCWEEIKMNDF